MSSMRSGFRGMVGQADRPKPPVDPGIRFVQFLAVLIVLGLVVWAIAR